MSSPDGRGQAISLERRRLYHEAALARAGTNPRKRFWAAAAWLLVEARNAGRLREVTGWLLQHVDEYRADTRYGRGRRAS